MADAIWTQVSCEEDIGGLTPMISVVKTKQVGAPIAPDYSLYIGQDKKGYGFALR